jgi:hypothetical protein
MRGTARRLSKLLLIRTRHWATRPIPDVLRRDAPNASLAQIVRRSRARPVDRLGPTFLDSTRCGHTLAPCIPHWPRLSAPMPDPRASPSHAIAHMHMRAPRVAYIVPTLDDWHRIAIHAMHDFTNTWGGAGFVVVPVGDDGAVHPVVLAALREYDPDAVLIPGPDRIRESDLDIVEKAQISISAVCTNYRSPMSLGDDVARPGGAALWTGVWGDGLPGSGQPTPLSKVADDREDDTTIGLNPELGGSLGLAIAARWGVRAQPKPAQIEVEAGIVGKAVNRLASASFNATNLQGATTNATWVGEYQTDLLRTLIGLDPVQEQGPRDNPALVVWGDDPADFALAMTWDRTYGVGIWIPDEWWQDENLRMYIAMGLDELARLPISADKVVFTSTSIECDDLSSRVEKCRKTLPQIWSGSKELSRIPGSIRLPDKLIPSRYSKRHFAIRENISNEWSTTAYEDDEGLEFAMLPPLPLIQGRNLEKIEENAGWQVDVSIRSHEIPPGTAIPETALLAAGESTFATRARVSRGGISYQAQRTDFVPAGASVSQSLTRPLLRYPSLLSWVSARASTSGLTARPSTAGTQAVVLAKMMGGRNALADLVSSDLLDALKAFNAKGATSDAYPAEEGCVINNEGYLHFTGICERAGITADAPSRDRIDKLIRAGVLRRGLLVRCPVCEHSAFVHIQDLASNIRCQRCLAENPLDRELWRLPVAEPTWFYDLHPIFRSLLNSNGDVPLLLSKHLRKSAERRFTDAPEFELLNASGSREVETDLLALADRRLLIAEAKSNNSLGTRKQRLGAARKRIRVAQILLADEVLLATAAESWEDGSVEAVKQALREQSWPTGTPPQLRIITGLGSAVKDEVIAV